MNRPTRKILALALSFALMVTGIPLTALTAYAQGNGCTHVCGDCLCDCIEAVPCDHEHDENCAIPCEHNDRPCIMQF